VRTPQVAIKAKIIFINRTGIQDIGLAYDLGTGSKQFFQQLVPRTDPNTLVPVDTDGDGVPDARGGGTPFQGPARIALGGNAISGIANANNAIKPNALNLIYSTALGRYQLTAFLNALQTSSLADVQSEPSVTILNNRTAEIFVGQEIPIRVIDASAGGGGQGGGGGGGGRRGRRTAAAERADLLPARLGADQGGRYPSQRHAAGHEQPHGRAQHQGGELQRRSRPVRCGHHLQPAARRKPGAGGRWRGRGDRWAHGDGSLALPLAASRSS
jgi:hypothetical protein